MLKTNLVASKGQKFLLIILGLFIVVFSFSFSTTKSSGKPFNIVVILTDDQRYDTMWAMPKTTELLGKNGVTFTEAIVSTPLCCPSRSGLFSGGYFARNTGVLTNIFPNGGAVMFSKVDKKSLPVRLQKNGYATGLFGKYFNEYPDIAIEDPTLPWPYIPPGWSSFIISAENNSPSDWFSYPVVKGSSESNKPNQGESLTVENKYILDYFGDEMLAFIEKNSKEEKPFFTILSTHGPHGPSQYPTEDADKFSDYSYSVSSMEEDLSDKPLYVQEEALEFGDGTGNQKMLKNMLRSLQPIDRSVEKIVQKLQELGELENTVIIFASDNGIMWGEHKLKAKSIPYEEAVRVPLIVVYPGGKKNILNDSYVYANLDVGATIQDISGLRMLSDGESLLPLLTQDVPKWRQEIYSEWFKVGPFGNKSSWSLIKLKAENKKEFKYIEYQSGEKELYLLSEDPYEENNIANDPQYALRIERLSKKLAPKKGISLAVNTMDGVLPSAEVGKYYEFQFEAWGSKKPYTWSITNRNLPAGLTFDSSTGLLYGTPTKAIIKPIQLTIKVVGSSKATYADRYQEFSMQFTFMIKPAGSTSVSAMEWFKNQDIKKLKLEAEDEVWRMN